MPKKISEHELEALIAAVAQYPEGVAVGTLMDVLSFSESQRTLQRRLLKLTADHRLIAERL